MPELRQDPVVDRWVIIAEERGARPIDTALGLHPAESATDPECPFCTGAEKMTPPESYALRPDHTAPDTPGWSLRVVPNKYPALAPHIPLCFSDGELYRSATGTGMHEVIVESSDHKKQLSDLTVGCMADLFKTVRHRFGVYRNHPDILCAQFFKNHGGAAGASLYHSHSQIIAMPVVSKLLQEQLDGARRLYDSAGECIYCRMAKAEEASGERMVFANRGCVAFAPYAPRFAYETWIAPRQHHCRFEASDDESLEQLAEAVFLTLKKINHHLDAPPYNMTLHSAPFGQGHEESFHWRIELAPILARAAGFEWGSGFHINTVSPEKGAQALREVANGE